MPEKSNAYFLSKYAKYIENEHNERKENNIFCGSFFSSSGEIPGIKLEVRFSLSCLCLLLESSTDSARYM